MNVIWKYPFEVSDDVRLRMPVGAKVLHVDMQHGSPTIWALVNPRAVQSERWFRVIGTGNPFSSDRLVFVATFQMPPFMWHVFECLDQQS